MTDLDSDYLAQIKELERELYKVQYEYHEQITRLKTNLSFIPEYFEFILKLKQVYPNNSNSDILNSYPLDTFSFYMDLLESWRGNVYTQTETSTEYFNPTYFERCEMASFWTFFRNRNLKASTELVQFFHENPEIAKVLFPHIMSKFETNKNDFLGLNPEHYELICMRLNLSIKKGNSTVHRITPLSK